MNKLILVLCVVTSALIGSSVFAAENLMSATEIENTVNAMDAQTRQNLGAAEYECWARGDRGLRYHAYGFFPERAQREAMAECYHFNRVCFAEGCRPR
jgi:hypothetical protein